MSLDFILTMILFYFFMIPFMFFQELGFDPEKMSIFPFLLFWIILILIIIFSVKYIMKIIRRKK